MELDLNRFRTLIPIDSLDEDKLQYLAQKARVERLARGEMLFQIGDQDEDSVFLMIGEIDLAAQDGRKEAIRGGSGKGLHALATLKPRRFSATVTSKFAAVVRIETDTLDRILTLGHMSADQDSGMVVNEFDDLDGPNALDSEWMMTLLQSPSFLKLPAGNIQELFSRLERVEVKADEAIILQGEKGDYYYLIKEGEAQVSREVNGRNNILAQLKAPQSFGEEALLSDAPRNATVTMTTDGVLMRLSKADFRFLMQSPLVSWVDLTGASQLVREGAVRIDVRTEAEFKQASIKGALNIPLYLLRLKMSKLDKSKKYVLFCDTGSRSAAAAFLFSQKGFQVHVLKGGLNAAMQQAKKIKKSTRDA